MALKIHLTPVMVARNFIPNTVMILSGNQIKMLYISQTPQCTAVNIAATTQDLDLSNDRPEIILHNIMSIAPNSTKNTSNETVSFSI